MKGKNNDASFLGALQIMANGELYAKGKVKDGYGEKKDTVIKLSHNGKFPQPVNHLLKTTRELLSLKSQVEEEVKGIYTECEFRSEEQRFWDAGNWIQEFSPKNTELRFHSLYEGIELKNQKQTLSSIKISPKLEMRRLNNHIFTITSEKNREYTLNINGNNLAENFSAKDIVERGIFLLEKGFEAQRGTRQWYFRADHGHLLDLAVKVFEVRMQKVFGVRRSPKIFMPATPVVLITERATLGFDINTIC